MPRICDDDDFDDSQEKKKKKMMMTVKTWRICFDLYRNCPGTREMRAMRMKSSKGNITLD